jgi:predicted nucleic acid-binding protein
VASVVARVEFASAAHAAERAGRIDDRHELLRRCDADCRTDGPIALLNVDPDVLERAFELARDFTIPTLDALHLAVMVVQVGPRLGKATLVSCDEDQLTVARSMGLAVAV